MITFQETVDVAERLTGLLKSSSELNTAMKNTIDDLSSFLSMLEFSHTKDFSDVEAALKYTDKVLIPQLLGIRDSLETGTKKHLKRLNTASELAERLMVRLRMLEDGAFGDFLT